MKHNYGYHKMYYFVVSNLKVIALQHNTTCTSAHYVHTAHECPTIPFSSWPVALNIGNSCACLDVENLCLHTQVNAFHIPTS